AHAAQPPQDLDAKLRQLEKQIAEVRGLAFKKPVEAKIIARPPGTDKGKQGYYDTREKRLYLYDDLSGAYERGVLIHEMVHALQDQHFGLEKLHQEATKPLAVTAAAGWKGDRVAEQDGVKTWVVAFQTPEAAARFHAALVKLRLAKDAGLKTTDTTGPNVWQTAKGGILAVLPRG